MANWSEIFLFIFILVVLVPAVGKYMCYVFREGGAEIPLLSSLERFVYKSCSVDSMLEMNGKEYLKSLLLFNLFGFLLLFFILLGQGILPFNPQHFPGLSLSLAFNVALSFVTNTDWEAYAGETTLSYFSQMVGLTTQNFLSAATGYAIFLVLMRGFIRKNCETIGNYWRDLTRVVIYIFLPFCFLFSIFLVSQGVVQTLSSYVTVTTLEGVEQTIPLGPVASQVAIKQLGTNGGGFFHANGAHPFENPSALTNFLLVLTALLIPAGLTYMYGEMTYFTNHGRIIFAVMLGLWFIGICIALYSESLPNPMIPINPILEGQETRFLGSASTLWSGLTSAFVNGSTNSPLSDFSPLISAVIVFNMMTGGVVFGSIGIGFCKMLTFVIVSAFLGSLLVGQAPEYLGKRIQRQDLCWVISALLVPSVLILFLSAVFINLLTYWGVSNLAGPHGLSELLYLFTSIVQGNGGSFIGANPNAESYNLLLALIMLLSRLVSVVPFIFIAENFARKPTKSPSIACFRTDNIPFGLFLICMILVFTGLTFFPALALGPIAEYLLMLQGRLF